MIDFLLRAPGRAGIQHGLEVKAWRTQVWEDIGTALYKRRVSHQAMTADELLAIDMFDGLVDQLKNAKAAAGREPYLMMTRAASKKATDEMMLGFWAKKVDPRLLRFDEAVLDDLIDKLAKDLSISHVP